MTEARFIIIVVFYINSQFMKNKGRDVEDGALLGCLYADQVEEGRKKRNNGRI